MIETRKHGDLFSCDAHAITNTVNCVGVMGKGIAAEFKRRYPKMFTEYVKLCKRNYIRPGKVWVCHEVPKCACEHGIEEHNTLGPGCKQWTPVNEFIVNFPTKDYWGHPSKLEWIAAGLDDLKDHATMGTIRSLAMPALGCTNGGLKFDDVQALVYQKLEGVSIPIILFEPQ